MCSILHTSACRPKSKLLEIDGARQTMLKMGSVHARDNGLGVSSAESERTVRYRDLLYARTGIGCCRSHRNKPRSLWHTRQEIRNRGVSTPPTETPGDLQVESQVLIVQHLYGHHKHGSYIGTHQFSLSWCKLFNYYRLSSDNVHNVFPVIQYPWLSNYGDQQGYNT